MSVNKVIIVGRLGNDPEVRQFQNGGGVTHISVATSERWTDKNTGEKKEQTEWHRISLFNRLGEIAAQYLRKGSMVYVEGSLHTRKYTDQQGIERYATEIRASEMRMLGGGANDNGGYNGGYNDGYGGGYQGGYQNNGYQNGGYQGNNQGNGGYSNRPQNNYPNQNFNQAPPAPTSTGGYNDYNADYAPPSPPPAPPRTPAPSHSPSNNFGAPAGNPMPNAPKPMPSTDTPSQINDDDMPF